jgi:hypothetical protein
MSDPMDEIEGVKGMRDLAIMARAFYDGLREQGFDQRDAITLTGNWTRAVIAANSGNKDDD